MATRTDQSPPGSEPGEERHPSIFEPIPFITSAILSILGAIVGLQLITTLGITANTSIIGALVAIVMSRIPLALFQNFRSLHRQNLLQTAVSGATFGSANALLLPIGIPYVLDRPDLVWPMLIGATAGLLIDSYVLYKVFDSRIFPASHTWPPGVAAAETIFAGDEGGRRAWLLVGGGVIGLVGSALTVPMSAFGVAFIANIWAITMFGIGLLVSGYAEPLFGFDVNDLYMPSGVMIGAGVVALIQVIGILRQRSGASETSSNEQPASELRQGLGITTDERQLGRGLASGFSLFVLAAVVLALVGGIIADMSIPMLIIWILFAAIAAMASELIVGLSAMHAGWFPAFGTALAFLVFGLLIGFPAVPLALLTGFTASTGPAFADMGYDFKAGWMIRSRRNSIAFELEGRRQQFYAELLGFGVGLIMVALFWNVYFSQDLIPPVDLVFADTIEAGTERNLSVLGLLALWAIPGGLIQWVGGSSRQMGILFATGLLIATPLAGWAVLVGVGLRLIILRVFGDRAQNSMIITAAGVIAGDAIYGFSSIFRSGS